MDLLTWPVETLAQQCDEETRKFSRHQLNDPRYCFELLRRALAEELNEAFTWVYRIYEKQVLKWVYQHYRFEQTGENADYFANLALSQFYFALRGPKFNRFPNLAKVLTYLKVCVHTAIMQYLRDQQPGEALPLDEAAHVSDRPTLDTQLRSAELWAQICRRLPDETDQQLARYVFIQGLKPRQIVEYDSARWPEERQISVALYRIRQVLRRDDQIRQWLSGNESTEPDAP